jgi:DNA-binding NarL/FixJ family response regulator
VLQDLETDVHLSLMAPSRGYEPIEPSGDDDSDMTESVSELGRLRVLIADDVGPTRRFLRAVLEHCRQFDVVGEADDGGASVEMAGNLQPDIVLLDLSMPEVDGATALRGIRSVAPSARVIIVSGMNPKLGASLLDTGAVGFVPKGIPPFELLDRLGSILDRPLTVKCREGWEAVLTEHRGIVFSADPGTRHIMTQVLERCGVVVTAEAGTAPVMLQVVEGSQPEVVVLDLSIDGMTPTAVIAEIHERSPRSKVIVYSAFDIWREKALAAGAAAFVLEPRTDQLEVGIRQVIERS